MINSSVKYFLSMTMIFFSIANANTTKDNKNDTLEKITFLAITEDLPPYNYQENNKTIGIATEILENVARKLDWKIIFGQSVSWEIAYEKSKQMHPIILFSTVKTKERESFFKWAGPIVLEYSTHFISMNESIKADKISDLFKYRIALIKNQVVTQYFESNHVLNNFSEIVYKKNQEECFLSLANKEVDLVVMPFLTAKFYENKFKSKNRIHKIMKLNDVSKEQLYFAFNINTSDEKIQTFRKALDEFKTNFVYVNIINKYVELLKSN